MEQQKKLQEKLSDESVLKAMLEKLDKTNQTASQLDISNSASLIDTQKEKFHAVLDPDY